MEKNLKQARKLEWEPCCSARSPEALETNWTGESCSKPRDARGCPGQGCCWESGLGRKWETAGAGEGGARWAAGVGSGSEPLLLPPDSTPGTGLGPTDGTRLQIQGGVCGC